MDALVSLGGVEDRTEYRIYASNDPDFYVAVDFEDYAYLAQYSWSIHTFNTGKGQRKKFYLRRSVSDFHGPDGPKYESPITGRLVRNRKRVQRNLFLHFVVMLRKGDIPPDKLHHIVDHEDRDTRNCRRANLHWSTPLGNRLNQHNVKRPRKKPRKHVRTRKRH